MFKKYHKNYYGDTLEKFKVQHNILVLVGNGFDISILKKYKRKGKLKGKTTSYYDFYDFITKRNLVDEDNILYKKMKEDKKNGKEKWSDFENSLGELLYSDQKDIKELEGCIDKFQVLFTKYLNELVDSQTLVKVNDDISKNKLAIQSFELFLHDLKDIDKFKSINKFEHFDLFYFMFFNFNYTSLLDNYIFLDKNQFDPQRYKNSDRNYKPKYKTTKYTTDTFCSSYLVTDIIHPHGVQDIPRSILFGIDLENYDKRISEEKRLVKSYWAQYDIKYKSYLTEAELFIIYGMSLGKTDAWWMDSIYDEIFDRDIELIIYKHGDEDKESVIKLFFDCCVRHINDNEEKKNKVKSNIHVVTFTENNTYFLGLEEK